MRTKQIKSPADAGRPRVNVVTLGCSKNIHDSEVLMGQLRGNSMPVVHEASHVQADDIVVINTCGFSDNAKQESIDTILQYSALKEEGKGGKANVKGSDTARSKT